jgi:hypothetical protein
MPRWPPEDDRCRQLSPQMVCLKMSARAYLEVDGRAEFSYRLALAHFIFVGRRVKARLIQI